MASSEPPSLAPSVEELSTRGATALLLPWILGMAAATNSSPREVAVIVHQPTRSVTLVEGSLDIESLLREIQSKEGPLPATKASIESLPRVQVSEPVLECPICLAEYEVNGEMKVKEMPCRHKFHSDCIDKWAGTICRRWKRKKVMRQEGGGFMCSLLGGGRVGVRPWTWRRVGMRRSTWKVDMMTGVMVAMMSFQLRTRRCG